MDVNLYYIVYDTNKKCNAWCISLPHPLSTIDYIHIRMLQNERKLMSLDVCIAFPQRPY